MIQKIVTYTFTLALLAANLCFGQNSLPNIPKAPPSLNEDFLYDKYGVLDPQKSYVYDDLGRLTSVEEFDGILPLRQQLFFWTKHPLNDSWLIKSCVWADNHKQPLICSTYEYDDRGNCIKETFHVNQHGGTLDPLSIDEDGNLLVPATTKISTQWTYSDTTPPVILSRKETIETVNPSQTNEEGFWGMYNKVTATLASWHAKITYEDKIGDDINALMKFFFDEKFHILLGLCESEGTAGLYNPGVEINPKVKLTAINGILNLKGNLTATIEQISEAHGNNQIHYVYRATEGWTRDIYSCVFVKMGFISPSAQMLADLWRRLIKELGGVNGGGTIIHYAHSIGTTDTIVAGTLLTPEERQMIQVFAFGSPSLFPHDCGFKSVKTYHSVRDLVAFIGFVGDPIRYANAVYDLDHHIQFVGTHWGMPIVDHLLSFDAYRKILEDLGQDFLREYGDKSLQ